jgi:hypothetical protein
MPVRDEAESIDRWLDLLFEAVEIPCEVLAVYDHEYDTTRPFLEAYSAREPRLKPLLNDSGPGPTRAIRYGIAHAAAETVVITMGDGADDPRQIDQLTRLVERGVVVACATRYSRGGQMVGGPLVKRLLSRTAGRSLQFFARVGTSDATNCFKACSVDFLGDVEIHSGHGFEIGIELVAKARRCRLPVAEVPTIWLDRVHGESKFRTVSWIPHYFRWYRFAFGGRLTPEEARRRGAALVSGTSG